MKHFGKKVEVDGYKLDSEKEANFYLRFVKTCGKRFEVHKSFELISKFSVGGYKPIKRTRKRQIAKAKHMMACHDHTSYGGHSGGTRQLENRRGGNNETN